MAARLNPMHQASVREKIKASQLINRLQNYALRSWKVKKGPLMTDGQIRAALGLLAKAVPDLRTTEHIGEKAAGPGLTIVRNVLVVDQRSVHTHTNGHAVTLEDHTVLGLPGPGK